MKKTILIFDFDGTIADTHSYFIRISNRLANEFNYNIIHPHEIELLKNKTGREIIQYLRVPIFKIPLIVTRAKREFYQSIHDINPIEGLPEILPELKACGVTMGILSSNNQENIARFLQNHDLNFFHFIHSTSKIFTKNVSLKELIHKNGFSPEEILYIGDETRDIEAAKKVGVDVIAVGWGYNSAQVLKRHHPTFFVHTPKELLELCKKLCG